MFGLEGDFLEVEDYDIIQSYKANQYIELKKDRKSLIKSLWTVILVFAIIDCIYIVGCVTNAIGSIELEIGGGAILGLMSVCIIYYAIGDNWVIRLENNVINIEVNKIFKSTVYFENLIDIQSSETIYKGKITKWIDIIYVSDKNRVKKNLL